MNDNQYQLNNYAVTGDPDEADHNQHYSEEIEELLRKTYLLVLKKKRDLLPRLQKLIKKYPRVPAFKNYLSTYYSYKGNTEKAFEVNRWLCKEHPDYLHGKINLAAQHIQEENYEKVPEILGEALDLQDLYPNRKVFHSSEFAGFFKVTCQYLIETDQLEAVESRLEIATDILPDESTRTIRFRLMAKRMENVQARQAESKANERQPNARGYDKSVQTIVKPIFFHEEMEILYQNGLAIEASLLKDLLALPRASLIADLEKVLRDSIARYEFFDNLVAEEGWEDHLTSFPLHAMSLLAELKSVESLPMLLEVLRQGEEFLEFWFSDHNTETLWEFLYLIGESQLTILKDFLLEKNIYYLGKSVITSAVCQIGFHQPERRQEVIDWYEELLTYFLDNLKDDDLIDTELISGMIWEVSDLKAKELIPLVKKYYELNLVDLFMMGDYEECERSFFDKSGIEEKHTLFTSTFERYQHILKNWHGYMSEEAREEKHNLWEEKMKELGMGNLDTPRVGQATNQQWTPSTVKRETPKVGRNEPCPCGSGKKYKKCCLKKK